MKFESLMYPMIEAILLLVSSSRNTFAPFRLAGDSTNTCDANVDVEVGN
jgi:hypothetical protein